MKDFNRLLEYRNYYIYDCNSEVFCIAMGEKHDDAKNLYTYLVDTYFPDELTRWEFEIALDCVHNFSDKDIRVLQSEERIFMYHDHYGMYVRNHYIHKSKKHKSLMADCISNSIEKIIYTIVLPVYNCFSKEFMKLMDDLEFEDIFTQYRQTQPIIRQTLAQLAEPDNTMMAKDALRIIRSTIKRNIGPDGFPKIAIPIVEEHIERYGHIKAEPVKLSNALFSRTRLYNKEYNQLQATIEMSVYFGTMGPYPTLKTLEETQEHIVDNLGISDEDALCMAKCAIAIGKKLREVLDRDKGN